MKARDPGKTEHQFSKDKSYDLLDREWEEFAKGYLVEFSWPLSIGLGSFWNRVS